MNLLPCSEMKLGIRLWSLLIWRPVQLCGCVACGYHFTPCTFLRMAFSLLLSFIGWSSGYLFYVRKAVVLHFKHTSGRGFSISWEKDLNVSSSLTRLHLLHSGLLHYPFERRRYCSWCRFGWPCSTIWMYANGIDIQACSV
ncbi:uncharacterized protein LOC110825728 isoform X2 [Carica papaya]|nr:uncharacterized protein LOC110825728 isoform X2 [Carica papaya]